MEASYNFASSFTFFSVMIIGIIEHNEEVRKVIEYLPFLNNIRYISIPTRSIFLFLASYYYHYRNRDHYIM